MGTVVDRNELKRICEERRSAGARIGFTSGVFDLLHAGHVDYLEKARAECTFLVVGVNSDSSVKENKGDLRPIVAERDRARVVAALRAVDAVFIFSEKNNATNIELLKPDLYIKAGDYQKESLSSAKLVEAYGGRVLLVPMLSGYSSSSIIDRISQNVASMEATSLPLAPPKPSPAVILDRDGTINEHVDFLSEPEKFALIPGAFEAIKLLRQHGFRIVVVTNQPGIGLGYFTREDFFKVNRRMMVMARKDGVLFDKIYFCPHSEAESCSCRKPATALVERAVRELNIVREKSFVVGDMTGDLQLAKNCGMQAVLVKTGMGGGDGRYTVSPDITAENLLDAAKQIIGMRA